jgi:hypothetical protein
MKKYFYFLLAFLFTSCVSNAPMFTPEDLQKLKKVKKAAIIEVAIGPISDRVCLKSIKKRDAVLKFNDSLVNEIDLYFEEQLRGRANFQVIKLSDSVNTQKYEKIIADGLTKDTNLSLYNTEYEINRINLPDNGLNFIDFNSSFGDRDNYVSDIEQRCSKICELYDVDCCVVFYTLFTSGIWSQNKGTNRFGQSDRKDIHQSALIYMVNFFGRDGLILSCSNLATTYNTNYTYAGGLGFGSRAVNDFENYISQASKYKEGIDYIFDQLYPKNPEK